MTGRIVSLASLSAIEVPPFRLVEYAAAGGFDAVGVRVAAGHGDRGHVLTEGSQMLADTLRALDDYGLSVLDVEVIKLHPGSSAADWDPVLAAGAALGARFVLATVLDEDDGRAGDNLAALTAAAAANGMRCCLEPMVFSAVRDLEAGRALTARSGARGSGLLLDALHWSRAGGTVAGLAGIGELPIPYWQICDASRVGPAADDNAAITEARGNRLAPGTGTLPLAAIARTLAGASVSVEVPSARGRTDPRGWAIELGSATHRLLSRVPPAAALRTPRSPSPASNSSEQLEVTS